MFLVLLGLACDTKYSLYDDDTVKNEAPVIDSISLSPDTPNSQTESILCVVSASDAEDDAFDIQYEWQKNGQSGGFTDTLEGPFAIGDSASCTAVALDNNGESTPAQVSVLILNTAPVVEITNVGPRPLKTNDMAFIQAEATDIDIIQTPTINFEWHVISPDGQDMLVQSGASNTLDGQFYFEKDDQVYCKLTPNDGDIGGEPLETQPQLVLNTPPIKPVAGLIGFDTSNATQTTEPIEGDDLICRVSEALDPDEDPLQFEVNWIKNGNPWTGNVFETYVPGDTIDGSDTFGGDIWECQIISTDTSGDSAASDWVTIDVSTGLVSATCADLLSSDDMWGSTAQGLDLRAWTNSTLHYIGCNGDGCTPSSFSCVDDPTAETIEFGSSGTLRAVVDPNNSNGDAMPTNYSGCCSSPLGLCNSFDSTNNNIGFNGAEALCYALGYSFGSITSEVVSNTCPEVHVNSADGLDWGSDFSNSNGYGNKYRCEGFR